MARAGFRPTSDKSLNNRAGRGKLKTCNLFVLIGRGGPVAQQGLDLGGVRDNDLLAYQSALLAHRKKDGKPFCVGWQVNHILAALDSGALKGASLDVFEHEPLPKDSRLWAHPAVYLSPHNAAISSPKAIAALVARQIEAYEHGEPLDHVVDRRRGY